MLDARVSMANVAHVELLQEVGSLCRQGGDAQRRYVSGDNMILRQEMNFFLDSFGSTNAFFVGYRKAMEDIRTVTERKASRQANIEANIQNDRNPPTARKDSASEALVRRFDN